MIQHFNLGIQIIILVFIIGKFLFDNWKERTNKFINKPISITVKSDKLEISLLDTKMTSVMHNETPKEETSHSKTNSESPNIIGSKERRDIDNQVLDSSQVGGSLPTKFSVKLKTLKNQNKFIKNDKVGGSLPFCIKIKDHEEKISNTINEDLEGDKSESFSYYGAKWLNQPSI